MGQLEEKELRILQVEETNDFVVKVAKEMNDVFVKEISTLHLRQRFVIGGRILNFLFSEYYGLALNFAYELYKKEVTK